MSTDPGNQPIDREKFLRENKLGDIVDIFVKRDIDIEELLEFDDENLRSFAKDIGLDSLQQNRIVKAINKLKSVSSEGGQDCVQSSNTIEHPPTAPAYVDQSRTPVAPPQPVQYVDQYGNPVAPPQSANTQYVSAGLQYAAPTQPSAYVPTQAVLMAPPPNHSVLKQASYMTGSVLCGIINLILGFVAWVLAIVGAVAFVTPIPQILGVLAILIFLLSNSIASFVGGICGDSCCSNCFRKTAWALFGLSCVLALGDIVLSLDCYGDCSEYRIAGAVISTIFFTSTVLFVIDNCNSARNIENDIQSNYKRINGIN
eukprot:953658_1